jgi:hypothetical protein
MCIRLSALRRLPATALLALTAACASARGPAAPRAESLLSDQPPPAGRECTVAMSPETLPPADLLVDSAGLTRDVLELGRTREIREGYALLSLAFDRNGWSSRRALIEHDLPVAVADSLQRLVFAHRREVEPGDPWGARLRVRLGDDPRLEVGRQEICAPRLRNRSVLADPGGMDVRERQAGGSLWSVAWIRVLIGEHGEVVDARIEQNPAGMRGEGTILARLRVLSFEPALIDGVPVPSWARVPIPLRGW